MFHLINIEPICALCSHDFSLLTPTFFRPHIFHCIFSLRVFFLLSLSLSPLIWDYQVMPSSRKFIPLSQLFSDKNNSTDKNRSAYNSCIYCMQWRSSFFTVENIEQWSCINYSHLFFEFMLFWGRFECIKNSDLSILKIRLI